MANSVLCVGAHAKFAKCRKEIGVWSTDDPDSRDKVLWIISKTEWNASGRQTRSKVRQEETFSVDLDEWDIAPHTGILIEFWLYSIQKLEGDALMSATYPFAKGKVT